MTTEPLKTFEVRLHIRAFNEEDAREQAEDLVEGENADFHGLFEEVKCKECD